MKDYDGNEVFLPNHVPVLEWKLKLKGVDTDKITEIETESLTYEEIYDEVHDEIVMAERYMKYNEAFRYGMVLATKIPTKEYSFENFKREFIGNISKPWEMDNAPIEYITEIKANQYLKVINGVKA